MPDDKRSFKDFEVLIKSHGPLKAEKYIAKFFAISPQIDQLTRGFLYKNTQVDISFREKANKKRWIVEIKYYKSQIGIPIIDYMNGKINALQNDGETINGLLIGIGGFTKQAKEYASKSGLYLWGMEELYDFYSSKTFHPKKEPSSTEAIKESLEAQKSIAFLKQLEDMPAGKNSWSEYQKFVFDIFEFLFCPPLENPQYEVADRDKRNRRDIIFENSSIDGFWKIVREVYEGHYIVVDAKNYKTPLNKRPVLDVAHYLKPFGCGLFALIISRKGAGDAAQHAIKEQWIGSKKMIICLSDNDLKEMLLCKAQDLSIEEIMKGKVAKFRISL